MAAGRGDLERMPGLGLADDVGEVRRPGSGGRRHDASGTSRLDVDRLAAQQGAQLGRATRRRSPRRREPAGPRPRWRAARRPLVAGAHRTDHRGQHARDRMHPAVEAELTDHHHVADRAAARTPRWRRAPRSRPRRSKPLPFLRTDAGEQPDRDLVRRPPSRRLLLTADWIRAPPDSRSPCPAARSTPCLGSPVPTSASTVTTCAASPTSSTDTSGRAPSERSAQVLEPRRRRAAARSTLTTSNRTGARPRVVAQPRQCELAEPVGLALGDRLRGRAERGRATGS